MNALAPINSGFDPVPAIRFPIGAAVVIRDWYGTELWRGTIDRHVGPYSVEIRTKTGFAVMSSTTRVTTDTSPQDEVIINQAQVIDEMAGERAKIVDAMEAYLMATIGKRRPRKIDHAELRLLAMRIFGELAS